MKTLLKQTGLAALYGLLVFLDDRYIADPTVLVAFEPASGLALAVLLIGGMRYAWGILIGAMMANMMEAPFMLAAITSMADVLEGLGAAWLLTRIGKFDAALGSLRDYLRLILFSAASIAVAGSIWCMASIAGGYMRSGEYWHEWVHWWLGDMLGIILLAPLILAWRLTRSEVHSTKRIAEAILLFGLTLIVGQVVFFGWLHDSIGNLARGYVMFLFVVWAAARLGTRGTVTIVNLIGLQALFGILHGNGYFSNELSFTNQSNYWFYMTILSIVGMALATFLTGQKQARQKLKQSEEEFERFFNLIPDMACIASTDGYFRKINRAWQAALGYAEQEILSTPFLEFIHPDDKEATMNEVARQVAGGTPMRFCNRYRCKDGSYRLLEWDMIPPVDGELLYGSARDITERKSAEDALIESEYMLREAQSLTHIGHFKYAPSTQTVEGSDELFKIFGLTREQFQFSAFLESVHPDDRALGIATIESAIERKASDEVEHRLLLRDGTLKWVKVNVKFVAVMPEEQSLLVGTIQDITERKQAEMRLRESEEQLQAIINNTSAVIFMKDTAGRYLLVNAQYERLFDISSVRLKVEQI